MLERYDKHTIQTLGGALIILGILLIMLGLIGIYGSMLPTNCSPSPCPPYSVPALNWFFLLASLFSGIFFVVVGIVLLILARDMKSKLDTDRANAKAAWANENYTFREALDQRWYIL